jgi:hypothetical protein
VQLTRKEAKWVWFGDWDEAFNRLKQIIGEDIVLKSIDYSPKAGIILLAVDSSFIAAGAVLSQQELDTGLDWPVLYKSIVFFPGGIKILATQTGTVRCGVDNEETSDLFMGPILRALSRHQITDSDDQLTLTSKCTND